jgi:hypothetical protein
MVLVIFLVLLELLELSASLTCGGDFHKTDPVQLLGRCHPPHDVPNVDRDHIKTNS